MRSEKIELSNKALIGEWRHKNSTERLIIICHGYQGTSKDPSLTAITEGLNKNGHDTFTFNFSENTGDLDIKHQVNDIAQIIEHFNTYHEIVLLAVSFAALPAAIATMQISSVTGLITLNGFFGTGRLGHEHRKNYIKFRLAALVVPKYKKILHFYKRQLKPNRIKVPVLVIHTQADEFVFIEQSRRFYEQLTSPKHFVTLETANHGVKSPRDRKLVVSEIHKWLSS